MTSVFLSQLIPSCNCHSNKRWYTGGMLRRYPKSNVSCCAVYQQSLSKMMHFYTNLWILKHTMKQTSGIAAVDIWARVSTSNHCTVGGPWMCQKCSVFFLFFFLNILSTRDSCNYQTSKIYLNSSTTERSQNFTQSRDKTI